MVKEIRELNRNADKFKFIGGAVGVDFVNTVEHRMSNPLNKFERDYLDCYRVDKLNDFADLLAWGIKAELIDMAGAQKLSELAAKESLAAENVLKRASFLRESVYRIFKSVVEGWQPNEDDLETLNRELRVARKHQKLSTVKGVFRFDWIDPESALDSILWQVAESAAETLLTVDLTRIRLCKSHECGWLFLDTSRNRSRQWCDMKDCGNLNKVRRFRQKDRDKDRGKPAG